MKHFYIYIITLFLLPLGFVKAQTAEADSLIAVLKSTKSDTVKISLMHSISRAVSGKDLNKSVLYAKKALNLAVAIGDEGRQLKSYFLIGKLFETTHSYDSSKVYYEKLLVNSRKYGNKTVETDALDALAQMAYYKGNNEHALKLSEQALSIARQTNDSTQIAYMFNTLSMIYSGLGKQQQALSSGLQGFTIFKKLGNKDGQIAAANNIGYIYDDLGSYAQALEYYLIALQLAEKKKERQSQAALLNNIGLIYEVQKDTTKALEFYFKAHKIATELNSQRDLTFLNHNIGSLLLSKGNYTEAYKYLNQSLDVRKKLALTCEMSMDYATLSLLYLKTGIKDSAYAYNIKALEIAQSCNDSRMMATCYNQLGMFYKENSKPAKAIESFKLGLSIADKGDIVDMQKEAASNLYQLMKEQKRFEEALNYYELHNTLKDSLFNEAKTHQLATLEAEYNFEKVKERLTFDAEKEQIKYATEIHRRQAEQKAAYIGLGLVSLLLFAGALLFYNKREANKALKAKNKEIQQQNKEIVSQWELLEQHKQELERKVIELDHLNNEKIKLISIVSHDLRSPLNQIKGLSHLIQLDKHTLTADQENYLDLIIKSTERLTGMICRILDVNALESNSVNLKIEIGDVGEVLSYVETNYQLAAKNKGITLHSDIEQGRFFAEIDKNYLIQVLENLLSNALKFSKPGTSVFLRAYEEGSKVKAIVTDNGPGISREDQKKLFGEYQKLTARPTGGEASSGLGLAIVKRYLQAMHADIEVLSELGKGTSFIISFDKVDIPQGEFVI